MIYNLIDNKFGRRVVRSILPTYFILLLMSSFSYRYSTILPYNLIESEKNYASNMVASPSKYLDALNPKTFVAKAAVQSKAIESNYLQLFIPFHPEIEANILKNCPNLKYNKTRKGLFLRFLSNQNEVLDLEKVNLNTYLDCLKKQYKVFIDDQEIEASFVLSTINNRQIGFESFLDIKQIGEGSHSLLIKTNQKPSQVYSEIPFWYFPS
ncbi:hypothetical protein [Echinicola sp. 20G]|uniref:hypothetical protein n=1 Tax=Echinicola sp. 20G TaxID=2781961 RepID=UPI00190FEF2E|nr:hypothetical protein [Echinicola sp. 20G]